MVEKFVLLKLVAMVVLMLWYLIQIHFGEERLSFRPRGIPILLALRQLETCMVLSSMRAPVVVF